MDVRVGEVVPLHQVVNRAGELLRDVVQVVARFHHVGIALQGSSLLVGLLVFGFGLLCGGLACGSLVGRGKLLLFRRGVGGYHQRIAHGKALHEAAIRLHQENGRYFERLGDVRVGIARAHHIAFALLELDLAGLARGAQFRLGDKQRVAALDDRAGIEPVPEPQGFLRYAELAGHRSEIVTKFHHVGTHLHGFLTRGLARRDLDGNEQSLARAEAVVLQVVRLLELRNSDAVLLGNRTEVLALLHLVVVPAREIVLLHAVVAFDKRCAGPDREPEQVRIRIRGRTPHHELHIEGAQRILGHLQELRHFFQREGIEHGNRIELRAEGLRHIHVVLVGIMPDDHRRQDARHVVHRLLREFQVPVGHGLRSIVRRIGLPLADHAAHAPFTAVVGSHRQQPVAKFAI